MEDHRRKLNEMEDLDEATLTKKQWTNTLLQRSISLTRKVVLYWCSLIIRIGENELNVQKRIEHFENKSEEMYEELILDIETVHEKYVNKIQHSMISIEEMCQELQIKIPQLDLRDMPLKELRMFLLRQQREYEKQLEVSRKIWK